MSHARDLELPAALSTALRQVGTTCDADVRTVVETAFEVLRARHGASAEPHDLDASFFDWIVRRRAQPIAAPGDGHAALGARARDDGEKITLEIAGATDDELAGALLDQLPWLLAQIAELPDVPVGAHSLVTPAAAGRLPDATAPLAVRQFERVPDTFFRCAERLRDHPAVVRSGVGCSYSDLAARVRTIARQLRASGLGPADVVALTGPRTVDVIAAMLGILAAPCVLLTLDPALPAERRRLMVAHAAARAVLAGPGSSDGDWSRGLDAPVSPVGGEVRAGRAAGAHAARLAATGGDAAYIFFTSGSTGTPKAVVGSHNGLAHFLAWQRTRFGIGAGDRSAQLTGLSFDVVLRDVLTPLTSGATLCLPAEIEDAGSGGTLAWLERERITLLHTVPSLAAAWLAQPDPAVTLRALRWVFFAGEALDARLVERWRSAFPSSGRIANFYGPTETTLAKCCFVVPNPPLPGVQPIGHPMAGAQALVVGPGDQLCGVGEPGEIVIRTPYRSHGYLDNPREQQVRFSTNPVGQDRTDVVYRTGDRGRYRPDGSLDILGRIDDEVKIRGVRVAPAEVSATILRQPGVREAVVIADRDAEGNPLLAAYVVPATDDDGVRLSPERLRADLARTLPPAFVPSRVALLDRLPLTPNGKVDRSALPRPESEPPRADRVAPRTDLERGMAEEWTALLGVPDAGIDDDFFALGGHSLLAAQLLARLRARFDVELPLRAIFDGPTIRSLSATLEDARRHA